METTVAERHYAAVRRAAQKYYESHKDVVRERRRVKYAEWRESHPAKQPGRPRKVVAEGSAEGGVAEAVESV